MNKINIKKNYLFNLMYQVLAVCTPLITSPYISRILQADGVGVYSYASSIVSYFVLFAAMGTGLYAQREISYVRDDLVKRSEVFWNVFTLRIVSSTIASLIYIGVILISNYDLKIYMVLLLNILFVIADISWFFQGMEEFQKIAIRDMLFKILGIVLIFCLVKRKNDIYKYVLIMSGTAFLSALSFWGFIPKYIVGFKKNKINPFKNFSIVISLFLPTIAIQVYTVLDKTMIGVITGSDFQNGYYEQATKIAKLVLTIVTSLGTVMVPRIGNLFKNGENELIKTYINRSYRFVWLIGVPLSFGIIGVAESFVPWFFGPGYDEVIPLLKVTALLILAIGISNVTGVQYLIPLGKQKVLTNTVIVGAIVNLILNLILIPKYGGMGAAIASVCAEVSVCVAQFVYVRKEIKWYSAIIPSWKYLMAGIIMLIVLWIENKYLKSSIVNTILMVITGGVVYFMVLFVLKEYFIFEYGKKLINRLKNSRQNNS